jgi:acyltransferase
VKKQSFLSENSVNVDFVRGVGIIAVVVGHFASPVGNFIYSWHMPLFFIISGYLTNLDMDFFLFIKKQFRRLIYPFLIWETISLITLYSKNILLNRLQPDFLLLTLKSFLWMNYHILEGQYGFVLWFLPALFIGRLLMYLLIKFFSNQLVVLLIGLFFFILSFSFSGFFNSDIGLNICLWMILGKIILTSKYFKLFNNIKYILLSILLLYIFYFFFGFPHLDIASKSYSNYFLINIIWAFIVVILISQLGNFRFKDSTIIKCLSIQTLAIFVLHPYTNNIADALLKPAIPNYFSWILETIVSFLLIFSVIRIIEKFKLNRILCLT